MSLYGPRQSPNGIFPRFTLICIRSRLRSGAKPRFSPGVLTPDPQPIPSRARFEIVNLDAHASNPGDLSWDAFQRLGRLRTFDNGEAEAFAAAETAHAVLTKKVPIGRTELERWQRLRYVGTLTTGTNLIDLEACTERGVVVTNVPAYSTSGVAQHAFALLLELTNRAAAHHAAVREGAWTRSSDFSFWLNPVHELAGLTLGIVGFGEIGRAVARIGAAFGMRIIAAARGRHRELAGVTVDRLPLDALFAEADVVSLHSPLTPETLHLVNASRLALMKRSALLLNVSRGPLVDEGALAEALNDGRISGAGIDVLNEEPPAKGSPLIGARNCIVTPHMAWASVESRERLIDVAANNLDAFLSGNCVNVVTFP